MFFRKYFPKYRTLTLTFFLLTEDLWEIYNSSVFLSICFVQQCLEYLYIKLVQLNNFKVIWYVMSINWYSLHAYIPSRFSWEYFWVIEAIVIRNNFCSNLLVISEVWYHLDYVGYASIGWKARKLGLWRY